MEYNIWSRCRYRNHRLIATAIHNPTATPTLTFHISDISRYLALLPSERVRHTHPSLSIMPEPRGRSF